MDMIPIPRSCLFGLKLYELCITEWALCLIDFHSPSPFNLVYYQLTTASLVCVALPDKPLQVGFVNSPLSADLKPRERARP